MFQAVQFPLKGPIAEILLITEWVISTLFIQLALIFNKRATQDTRALKSLQERAYFWVYLSFSIMWIFFIIGDYYVESSSRRFFSNCGYVSLMLGVFNFILSVERNKIFGFKYIFSIIFLLDIVVFFLSLYFAPSATQVISFTFWPLFIVFFLFFIKELRLIFKLNPVLGNFRSKYVILSVGITLLIIGFGLTTDLIIQIFGLLIRLIGDIIHVISLLLLFLFFKTSPSFSEYEWQDKIESIYIMHKSGLLIYQKSFEGDSDKESYDSSKSGVLTSLKMMLDNIGDQDEVTFIEKKGKLIFIQPGKHVYGVLICKKKLNSLMILLNNFINKIESLYSNILENWDGNLVIFKPLNDIVREFFY